MVWGHKKPIAERMIEKGGIVMSEGERGKYGSDLLIFFEGKVNCFDLVTKRSYSPDYYRLIGTYDGNAFTFNTSCTLSYRRVVTKNEDGTKKVDYVRYEPAVKVFIKDENGKNTHWYSVNKDRKQVRVTKSSGYGEIADFAYKWFVSKAVDDLLNEEIAA